MKTGAMAGYTPAKKCGKLHYDILSLPGTTKSILEKNLQSDRGIAGFV